MIKKYGIILGGFIYVVMTVIALFEFVQTLFIFSDWYDDIYFFKTFAGIASFVFFFLLEFLVILPISKKYNYPESELRNFFSIKNTIKKSEKIMFVIISVIAIFSFIVIYKRNIGIQNELYYLGLIAGPLAQYSRICFCWLRRKMGK